MCFNDKLDPIFWTDFDAIVLSPGPGLPGESGQLLPFVQEVVGKKPVLGVCLGMQALALVLGGELYNQKLVKHGIQEEIEVSSSILFAELSPPILVGLYHSWAISENGDFTVTATSNQGVVMALENNEKRCFGVQFHPESIMTPQGKRILENFLSVVEVEEKVVSVE